MDTIWKYENSNVQISVILPAYQAERTLKRAIESVRGQTFKDWELLIINDGSKDATEVIARQYQKSDPRIILICQTENQGPSNCRNLGILKMSLKRHIRRLNMKMRISLYGVSGRKLQKRMAMQFYILLRKWFVAEQRFWKRFLF